MPPRSPPSPDRSRRLPSGRIRPVRAAGRAWQVGMPPRTMTAAPLQSASKRKSPKHAAAEPVMVVGRILCSVRTGKLRPAAATRATIHGQNPMHREAPGSGASAAGQKPRSAAKTSCTVRRPLPPRLWSAFARADIRHIRGEAAGCSASAGSSPRLPHEFGQNPMPSGTAPRSHRRTTHARRAPRGCAASSCTSSGAGLSLLGFRSLCRLGIPPSERLPRLFRQNPMPSGTAGDAKPPRGSAAKELQPQMNTDEHGCPRRPQPPGRPPGSACRRRRRPSNQPAPGGSALRTIQTEDIGQNPLPSGAAAPSNQPVRHAGRSPGQRHRPRVHLLSVCVVCVSPSLPPPPPHPGVPGRTPCPAVHAPTRRTALPNQAPDAIEGTPTATKRGP